MIVGVLRVELSIGEAQSLKDKRRVIKSIKERLTNKFNVSAAEVDAQDVWQRSVIGIALVANESRFVHSCLDKIIDWIRRQHTVTLIGCEKEVF